MILNLSQRMNYIQSDVFNINKQVKGFLMATKAKKFIRTEQEQTPVLEVSTSYVPMDELQLWKDNPWNHKKIIPRLAEALAIHGQVSPVVADRKTKIIYKGNHTYQAMNYLHKHIRSISNKIGDTVDEIRNRIDTTMIKVEFHDFPSEQAAIAYGIADNNLSKGGKYDPDTMLKIFRTDEEYFVKNPRNMSFSERELKLYRDHRNNCNPRPRNYQPNDEEMIAGNYMILTFNTPEVEERLRECFEMDKSKRKIQFENLYPFMNKEFKQYFDDVIDLPF